MRWYGRGSVLLSLRIQSQPDPLGEIFQVVFRQRIGRQWYCREQLLAESGELGLCDRWQVGVLCVGTEEDDEPLEAAGGAAGRGAGGGDQRFHIGLLQGSAPGVGRPVGIELAPDAFADIPEQIFYGVYLRLTIAVCRQQET